jgi:hypothetical protein
MSTIALNTNTQATIDAGMAVLTAYDPATAAALQSAVNNGSVNIVELRGPFEQDFADLMGMPDYEGMCDGNTIALKLHDGVDAARIAARLQHEFGHYSQGGPYDVWPGGCLDACGEFYNYLSGYNLLVTMSCDPTQVIVSISCGSAQAAIDRLISNYLSCVTGGGAATWPSTLGAICCN